MKTKSEFKNRLSGQLKNLLAVQAGVLLLCLAAASLSAFGQGGMFMFRASRGSVDDWWSTLGSFRIDNSNNVAFLIGSGTPLVDTVSGFTSTGTAPGGMGTNTAHHVDATTIWNAILGDPNYTLAVDWRSNSVAITRTTPGINAGGFIYNSANAFPVTGTSTAGGSISVFVIGWSYLYPTPQAAAAAGSPVGWSAPFTYTYGAYPDGTPGRFDQAAGWYLFAVEPPGSETIPFIYTQPVSQSLNAGNTAQFSVDAGGALPLSYQWSKDGVGLTDGGNISGTQIPTLSLNNVFGGDRGGYSVVISNTFGSVTSVVATLSVVDPGIISPPASQTVIPGQTVQLSVAAFGTLPLSYQWLKDGVNLNDGGNIFGSQSATLTLSDVSFGDAGWYDVVASNAYGSVTSAVATLTVSTFSDANWVSLVAAMNADVCALAVSGTNLYVAGAFTQAGAVEVNRIAKWDGSAWSALGSGMDKFVFALAASGTNLYAGGLFTTAGGVPATNIAKWDGSAWSALGSGMNDTVYALAVSGTNLYAGGDFTTAGGVAANHIAKWDGSAWSALGSGIGGPYPWIVHVEALAVNGTDLYAGGSFTTAGGVAANNIAKWNGSAWSALSSGMGGGNLTVSALAVSRTNLYAGGYFTDAGGVPASGIAKWNGSAWSALGSGISGSTPGYVGPYVSALAVDGTDLYAGGCFTGAGGVPANNIAKWDGNTWSPLGSGINGIYPYATCVRALAVDGVGHLFVGGQFSLAGTNVSPNIAQANLGNAPTIATPPQPQTAEAGGVVNLAARVTGYPPSIYQWFFNGNAITGCTNRVLCLSDVQATNVGTYWVVVCNIYGAVTSAPVVLNVILLVARRPAPGINLIGDLGTSLNVEYSDVLGPPANWLPLDTVSLTNPPQYCFDVSAPLPPERFYRAWQSGTPSVVPSLNLNFVPAITLTGDIGSKVRLDYINAIGPTDAWVTLDTITLTNTSQLYFDVSAPGQPRRLYRIVPVH
jgi:hypothetical protein